MTTSTAAWRRALRRVERRAVNARSGCPCCSLLLEQAVRTANRLAVCAGIV
jgi:hypothetical protein